LLFLTFSELLQCCKEFYAARGAVKKRQTDASCAEQYVTIIIQLHHSNTNQRRKPKVRWRGLRYLFTALSFKLGKNAAVTFEFLQKDQAKESPNPQVYT